MFTIFPRNYEDGQYTRPTDLFKDVSTIKFAIWQIELCPTSHRHHIQGYLELPKVVKLPSCKHLFVQDFQRTVHIEKRRGTQKQAVDYCSKMESKVCGPYSFGGKSIQGERNDLKAVQEAVNAGMDWDDIVTNFVEQAAKNEKFIKNLIEARRASLLLPPPITLRPWQESLLEKLKGPPHPRQVMWYYDEVGHTGKSTFAIWLRRSFPKEVQLFVGGGQKNVAYCLESNRRIFIFDYSRQSLEYIQYSSLEHIKNGYLFSEKYQPCIKEFETPHVLCFANERPNVSMLSRDRWDINHIAALGEWSLID